MPIQQRGFAQILILILLLVGIGVGVYLVQQKTNFLPKASGLTPLALPLGIHLVPDADINSFWNSHAKNTDVSSAWPANMNYVVNSSAGVKVLIYGDGADSETAMNSAKSAGISMVMANLEEITDINALLTKETSDYKLAKSKGLIFIFAPMGTTLKQYYSYNDFAMLKNADIIFYQTQIMQDNATLLGTTDPSAQITQYASIVKDLISKMRPYIPQRKVWVQVSVNPPQNRNTTADRVIQYIDSITDGSADSPDEIQVFYKYTDYPEQIPVLKEVIEHYRPLSTPTPTPTITPTPTPSIFTNLSVELSAKKAIFSFDYKNGFASTQSLDAPESINSLDKAKILKFFTVSVSTSAGMLLDTKANFGWGKDSPITVHNPQGRWGSYRCGTVLYWRVYSPGKAEQSPIQNSRVVCEQQPL